MIPLTPIMEKITKKDTYFTKKNLGVVAGVIVTAYIPQIFSYIGNLIAASSNWIAEAITTLLLQQASHYYEDNWDLTSAYSFAVILSVFGYFILEIINTSKTLTRKKYQLNKLIKNIKDTRSFENDTDKFMAVLRYKAIKIPSEIKRLRRKLFVVKFILVSYTLIILTTAFLDTTKRDYYMIFRQSTDIIAPYVGEEKVVELNSKWRQMKSKEDYMMIMNTIDSTFKANNIQPIVD